MDLWFVMYPIFIGSFEAMRHYFLEKNIVI
jgi:hypothetical protein